MKLIVTRKLTSTTWKIDKSGLGAASAVLETEYQISFNFISEHDHRSFACDVNENEYNSLSVGQELEVNNKT